jgi:threonine/homoserine/homoserine lactone efflux protein
MTLESQAATVAQLAAFAAFAFVTAITPGPNNTLAAAVGANFGWRSAAPQAWGVALGCAALLAVSAFGVAALLAANPWIGRVLAVASAAYLLWMAFKLYRQGRPAASGAPRRDALRPQRWPEAALFQLSNPKAWMTALAGSTGFLASAKAPGVMLAGMCAIQAVVCFPSVLVWAFAGSSLSGWLAQGARMRAFNAVMALSLAAIAVWVVAAQWTGAH